MTVLSTMMPLVVRLAGLMHDLGKVNHQFQINKFGPAENAKTADPLAVERLVTTSKNKARGLGERWRHELLSVFQMYHVIAGQDQEPANDQEGLERLKDWSRWEWVGQKGFGAVRNPENLADASALMFTTRETSIQQHPLLSALFWLVLSHHRLPNQKALDANDPYLERFDNLMNGMDPGKECEIAPGEVPWDNVLWRAKVQETVDALMSLVTTAAPDDQMVLMQNWVLWSTHVLRPILIGADHMAASAPVETLPRNRWNEAIHANSRSDKEMGDTLTTHLRRVGSLGDALWDLVTDPDAPATTIPKNSRLRETSVPDRFRWQICAEEALRPQAGEDVRPTFVAVIAETGSGKTLGGARILAALRTPMGHEPVLRATFAFGMRSITLQTGQELFDANIDQSDIAVLVGNPASRLIFERQRAEREDQGAESAAEDQSFEVMTHPSVRTADQPADWLKKHLDHVDKREGHAPTPQPLSQFFTQNGRKIGTLLTHPIVVCTIDHLIHGVEAERSAESLHALRAMTADLVLDELDAYSAMDLISLNKLVMLHGMAARNVVIMSATLSPVVATAMFDAWKTGLDVRRTLLDDQRQPRSAVVFNNTPYLVIPPGETINVPATSDRFARQWGDAVQALLEHMTIDRQRRRFHRMDLPEKTPGEGWGTVWSKLAETAVDLHVTNHVEVPVESTSVEGSGNPITVRVSAGFIRFNTARQAAMFARWALTADHPSLANVRVLSYHSKYPMLHLSEIESSLNTMLRRKDGNENFGKSRLVKDHLVEPDGTIHRDVIFIVCTTTLNETGRDHDYDWCILEPRSVRGEVQAIGRVRRHRPDAWRNTNVMFMNRSLRSFDNPDLPWGFPGIETMQNEKHTVFKVREGKHPATIQNALTALGIGSIPSQSTSEQPILFAEQGLPFAQWEHEGFNARPCLTTPVHYTDTPIGSMEMVEQFAFLKDEDQSRIPGVPPSARAYREKSRRYAWFGGHAKKTRFRQQRNNPDGTVDVLMLKDVVGKGSQNGKSIQPTNPLLLTMNGEAPAIADKEKASKGKGKNSFLGQKQEAVPIYNWYDGDLDTQVKPGRVFWRWRDGAGASWSMPQHVAHLTTQYHQLAKQLPVNQNVPAQSQLLLLSIQMPPRGNHGTPDQWPYRFHPLIGLWRIR